MLSLRGLEVLTAVARSGSLRDAADQLGMSWSAASQSLRSLEDLVGAPIAMSVHGRLTPTPEGLALIETAGPAFGALARVRHEAAMLEAGLLGRLRVVAAPSLAHSLLAPAIGALARDAPALPVELAIDDVAERLAAGLAEIGFSFGVSDTPSLVSAPARRTTLICALRCDDPLCDAPELDLGALAGRRIITYEDDGQTDSLSEAIARLGIAERAALTVRHTGAALDLVREGCGTAIIDGFAAETGIGRGLAFRPFHPLTGLGAFVHWPRGRGPRAAVLDFVRRLGLDVPWS